MKVKVRLIGVEPKQKPCQPQAGWYEFGIDPGSTVAGVLNQFGLKSGALSVLINGSLTDIDAKVDDRDELHIMLKSLGG